MNYQKTQKSSLAWILTAAGFVILVHAWIFSSQPATYLGILTVTIILFAVALFFSTLTIQDQGMFLCLRFGPLPLIKIYIRYSDITDAVPDRSSILDGWGIHYIPWRGWTYNLWGFKCVRIQMGEETVRVGTSDPEALAQFINNKISTRC